MSLPISPEKGTVGPEHIENVQNDAVFPQQTHYKARNDEEKNLDRRLNFKLDLIVVSLLAIEFIVKTFPHRKTKATRHALTRAVLWHRQDKCRFRCNQLLRQRRKPVS